jgi:acetate kinase
VADLILVLNAGSSSLKFSAFDARASLALVLRGQIEGLYTSPRFGAFDARGADIASHRWGDGAALGHEGAIGYLAQFLRDHGDGHRLLAAGHRVVHGGLHHVQPARVTTELLASLRSLTPLAPLHQPHNLKAIEIVAQLRPDLPQVACFDTAFHRSQPELAQAFALPASITELGVRRYGFHGLSYEYIASVLPKVDGTAAKGRTIVAHLGNGSSACALVGGRSVASTMGFTAVDGLPMGTRSGSLDPGVLLYLIDELKMDARAIERLLYQQSGLSACRACPATCDSCWPATTRARASRSSSTATASRARSARWRRPRRASTRWCSRPASASTRRRSASACVARRPGSACSSTRRHTRPARHASARR